MPLDAPLVHRARELARVAHVDHERKGGGPYFAHLEATARILVDTGATDEAQIAAAYLHDLLEDRPTFEPQLREQMPAEVTQLVELLTETKLDGSGRLRPKRERFADYVARLREDSALANKAIPISCADKVHNMQSLVEDEEAGKNLLLRLRTRPGDHREQLATLSDVYASKVNEKLRLRFDHARVAMLDMIARWLPGRAVMIAAEAHLGQFDKAGAPYVNHPLRLRAAAQTETGQIVAVLHDVVEDSAWTLEELRREGFSEDTLRALDALTKREGESYDAFISRVADNPLAKRIKKLDLKDNLDPSRIAEPTAADAARAEKYRAALDRLS